jgi:SAM-dependent methyltransferase
MEAVLPRKVQKLLAWVPLGATRDCVLCGGRVRRFLPYRGGWRCAPPLMREWRMIGSDPDNYECPRCGCSDRERHLFAYLQADGLLQAMRGKSLLQFAPEPKLTPRLVAAGLARHVQADLFPQAPGVEKIDLLAIPYADATFDFVMVNHVLEHVADDVRALAEIRRVLRPGGLAVLQTPFSAVLERTLSDPAVQSPEARLQLYGQEDHVRLYGQDIFARFESAGLRSRVRGHQELLPDMDPVRYGVNRAEPFFLFERSTTS